jgi:hypothetical protein
MGLAVYFKVMQRLSACTARREADKAGKAPPFLYLGRMA